MSSFFEDPAAGDQNLSLSELTMPGLSNEALSELFREEEDNVSQAEYHIRFCKDDIYATYLSETHFDEAKSRVKPTSRQKMRTFEKQADTEARFFAVQRIDGPPLRYFGGLPVALTPRVESWINHYKTQGREEFLRWLVRSESHKDVVVPLLVKEGLPRELFFLAMIESGFNNSAYSRKQATGTWQFMQGTARSYGLRINYWVDERRDPVKSTVAAARYLRDLYSQFNDWYLAIAAYNAGPGKIRRAIRNTKSRDYWRIAQSSHISKETKQYVPKILAALMLASHPERHGFTVVRDMYDYTPVSTVPVGRPVKINEVADELGVSVVMLKRWNPELIHNIVPPPHNNQPYLLRLPRNFAERFSRIEGNLSQLDVSDIMMHRVRAGETLSKIAKYYKINVKQILSVNPLLKPERLKVGNEIAIPIPSITTKA